jgi:ribosome-associated protein
MSAGEAPAKTALELTALIAAIADDKQAEDIVALEVGDLVGYTDYLLICTARNERLAKAIHDEVYVRLKHEQDRLPAHSEGVGENRWILLDYVDCILHIFVPETRERYRLDQLWGEAAEVDLGNGARGDAVRRPA